MTLLHNRKTLSLVQIQWIIWLLLFGINVLALLQFDPLGQALAYSSIVIVTYAAVVYVNANLLLPQLYEKNRLLLYVLAVLVFLVLIAAARNLVSFWVYNRFYAKKTENFRWGTVINSFISILFVYLSSILFYIALNYFRLRQKQEQLQKKNAETELNLLKAQVQPHFLFNTLNNIYFVAQRESPETAALLDKLSQIMRYFVDEAPKEKIPLQVELDFIKHYIELERMRMRYPLQVNINITGTVEHIMVPPMLFIPLVENVFKHGIDKRREDNFLNMSVLVTNDHLMVEVENRISEVPMLRNKSGSGLRNLESRLKLLFNERFEFGTSETVNIYKSRLKVPV